MKWFLIFFCCLLLISSVSATFISTWDTRNTATGSSNASQLNLSILGTYDIDWGDGTPNISNQPRHNYTTTGVYTVRVNGTITSFINNKGEQLKLMNVTQWGDLRLNDTAGNHFNGNTNLNLSFVQDALNLTGVVSLANMFIGATKCTTINNTNSWDTSQITDMSGMFQNMNFNGSIKDWNTGKVTTMANMFNNNVLFNSNISAWNTSELTGMSGMFSRNPRFNQSLANWDTHNVTAMNEVFNGNAIQMDFNQPLNTWNTSKVTTFAYMFNNCIKFNQNLTNWDTSKATAMQYMFGSTTLFNGNISNWNTVNVTTMNSMFANALVFNGDISSWNTVNVKNMQYMFQYASAFNQPLNTWNTGNVTTMNGMFYGDGSTTFNQDLNNWNTANVTDMSFMFYNNRVFNGNVSTWNTSKVNTMESMFEYAYLFNKSLNNWDVSKVTTMKNMFANARIFNQPLDNWNTVNVTSLNRMFATGTFNSFNQNISMWNISKVSDFASMFSSSASMSTTNYDSLLLGWSSRPVLTSKSFNGGSFTYSNCTSGISGVTGRNILTSAPNLWTITDGGKNTTFVCPDSILPNVTLISPINNTITTNLSNNFTANLSDDVGISNYTLNIYNSTSLINQTTVLTPTNPLTLTAGIVVTLVEGTYNWFYNLFDTSTNSFTSKNYTLTISSSCSPTLNVDWIITDAQTCDATQVTTGTGSIIITTGNLTLKNGANVTSKSLNISITGDKVFIYRGSELRLS